MSRTLLVDHWNPIALTLTEDKGDGKIRARGVFASVGKPTKNGRRYGKAIWEKEIARLTPAIKAGGVVMELDHPEDGKTKLVRAAAKLTDLHIEGEDVMGELTVLSTSRGKELGALISDGVQVGVSSRGFGTTKPRNDGTEDVSEDYKLVTFDAVADPAAPSAYPTFYTEEVEYLSEEAAGLIETEDDADTDADELDEASRSPRSWAWPDPSEPEVAKRMFAKGYRYQVTFKGVAPMYVKSPDHVPGLMRLYKSEGKPKIGTVSKDGSVKMHEGEEFSAEEPLDEEALRSRLAEELLDSIREFRERAYADALEAVGGKPQVTEGTDAYGQTITELRAKVRELTQESEALRDEIARQGKVTEDADGDESVASALHLAALRIHLEERLHRVKNHEAAREFVGDLMQYEGFAELDSRLDRFTDTIGLTEYGESTDEDADALRQEVERLKAELEEASTALSEAKERVEEESEVQRIEAAKALTGYRAAALAGLSESVSPLIRRRIRTAATTDEVDRAVVLAEDSSAPSIGRTLMERVRAKARRSLPRGESNPEHEADLQGEFGAETSTGSLIDSVQPVTEVGGMRIDEIVEMADAAGNRRF